MRIIPMKTFVGTMLLIFTYAFIGPAGERSLPTVAAALWPTIAIFVGAFAAALAALLHTLRRDVRSEETDQPET